MTAKEIKTILATSKKLRLTAILITKTIFGEGSYRVIWYEWSIVDNELHYEYDYFVNIKDIKEIRIM